MSEPAITILVPTIGRMEFLPETRRSIDEQTETNLRVVILDNDSPPEGAAYLAAWAASDPRVEIRRVSPRIPMFANFNRGFRATTTKYVAFFHDDDVYHPRFVETLVRALEAHPAAAFAGSNFDFIDASGRVTEERRWIPRTEVWPRRRYVAELVGRGRNPVPMPGLVFRSGAFPDGFDESLPIHFGDYVLLMRAAEDGGMLACAEPVVSIRRHDGQASALPLSHSIALRTDVLSEYLDGFARRHPDDRDLVARLRTRVALSHRVGMVWGWVIGANGAERDACLAGLGSRRTDDAVRAVLKLADRVPGWRSDGLGRGVGTRMLKVARRAADALGV